MEDEKQGDVTVDLYTALDMESSAVEERSPELVNNQSLGLLNGFLSVDDWYHAHILFDRLSPLNPVAHDQICKGLFRIIEKSISSAYAAVRQTDHQNLVTSSASGYDFSEATDGTTPKTSFIHLPKELFQMLASAGPYLYRNTLLLQKVCRVLRGYYLSALELVNCSGGPVSLASTTAGIRDPNQHLRVAKAKVEDALGTCILPSLQLIPANPAVGQEIWELMCLLPYEARYHLYGEWEKENERIPMVLAARQTAKLDTRRILKRLAKENLKQLGRMVAKLAHANPMTVLRTIVHQIEAYRDMIAPVVDAFKYLTQLEYDILEYVVIERLAQGGRDKLKDDGVNLCDWLQSLASFWGHLCKKYPSMELRGLFQYLVNQLKKGKGIELVLLQELIQQMANVQYTENMTEEQLDAMAGSETLRYQATAFGMTRNNKALVRSTNRLRDSLLPKDEPKLALPLLLLIAQHRALVVINADAPYIKMVSEQFDRCHGTLLQYVEFLNSALTPTTAYAQLIPPLEDLVHKYHLDPEVAFLIYRPVMRLFKCASGSEPDVFWPCNNIKETSMSNTQSESSIPTTELVLDLGYPRKPIMWSELLDTVKEVLPSKAWNSLSPDLYATFWGLTLYDLYVPKSRYDSEIAKQHAALKALEELSDNSSSAITKRKKDKERIQELLDRLTHELRKHEENAASVRQRLAREKDKWLSSCPDTLKINMEFLQRCIFPRCIFSMLDAVYCAQFVRTLHSLGTPFFNTVNHIDVLICKTLQPMICCCTEYEAGRLGRFLFETLEMAYHWKKKESTYERECGNMPGFAVYYRYPNSQRVTYGQFVRVAKIKGDEREDLKVLATGVAAALASRKSFWVTDEEFCMGYVDLKPAAVTASKPLGVTVPNGSSLKAPQMESAVMKNSTIAGQLNDSGNLNKDPILRARPLDGRLDRTESITVPKSDPEQPKLKGGSLTNGLEIQCVSTVAVPSGMIQKHTDDPTKGQCDETMAKVAQKPGDSELRATIKRSIGAPLTKQSKHDGIKDENKSVKPVTRHASPLVTSSSERDLPAHPADGRQSAPSSTATTNGNTVPLSSKVSKAEGGATRPSEPRVSAGKEIDDVEASKTANLSSFPEDSLTASKSMDKQQKRAIPSEELDRLSKRRKDNNVRDGDGEGRFSDRDRSMDARFPHADVDKTGIDDQGLSRATEKLLDRSKEKGSERYDRDHRERLERPDKSIGDEVLSERPRDRSMERHGRERSIERVHDRNFDRVEKLKDDRYKDDRSKLRYSEAPLEKSHIDDRDRFNRQSLPPPPPLPSHMVPQSVSGSRRDEDADRRVSNTRHMQRLSPRHEEKDRRRSEEISLASDDAKRRREEDFRERKRDERDGSAIKVEEREKVNIAKDDLDTNAASKRRKLKRDHLSSSDVSEYPMGVQPLPSASVSVSQSLYDGRERAERKVSAIQRAGFLEEPSPRMHGKEAANKITRRDSEQYPLINSLIFLNS
ncbi:hypothetical protein C5167_050352 [Papaver somniferum]|uniref:THO complex subunit 2 n=1 Tax=Papaver somniferum TaxID=3469 RepID=A0A4Y7KR98_PAPSO|nr:hypothetical protein C5167_050352 [Papaver somniferum]